MPLLHRSVRSRSWRGAVAALAVVAVLGALAVAGAQPARAAEPAADPTLPPIAERWTSIGADGEVLVHLYFGWTSTCPHCAKARPFVAEMERELPWLVVHSYQLDGPDAEANARVLVAMADELGVQIQGVPAFFYDAHLRTGFEEAATTGERLRADLVEAFERALPAASARPAASAASAEPAASAKPAASARPAASADPETSVDIPLVGDVRMDALALPFATVLLAGMDAVNPCALSVLLFLLGLLSGMNSRRRMLLVGGTFIAVSGLAYFLFMTAWVNIFQLAGAARIVTLVAGVAAIAAALVNIKDYAWFGRGPSLVIPARARPFIFGRLVDLPVNARLSALLLVTIFVALAANLYEALCTGGFPVVFTRILTLQAIPPGQFTLWIALYCAIYVIPLVAILVFVTWRLGSHTVTIVEAQRLKLLSGLLMLGLGLLLVLAPERLGDLLSTVAVFALAVGAWLVIVLATRRRPAPGMTPPAAVAAPAVATVTATPAAAVPGTAAATASPGTDAGRRPPRHRSRGTHPHAR